MNKSLADMTEAEFHEWRRNQVTQQRVREGRCGDCGVFDGPTHRCPQDTVTKTTAAR